MLKLQYTITVVFVFILINLNSFGRAIIDSPEADSISVIEKIKLGRVEQTVMIHGADPRNPVLLIIQWRTGIS